MLKRIECAPNISEGRSAEVIAAVSAAVSEVPEVLLLDRSSDPDHNRTVLTLVGSPEGLKEAILRLFAAAIERIDLRRHEGKHPRMGAVDVVPFIPLRNATMADCVALARNTAQAVADRFGVPIYLYAEAATRPERVVLSHIRKGEFEGLAAKMADPAWRPDFGPAQPHLSAGASAIGARFFLIAYNLNLDTADVGVAHAVARAARASSGGLMNVQAMGIGLDRRSQAQVSMNLLNFRQTPIHRVQELVKAEAARYGARVLSSEIVGLIPREALLEAAAHYLQVENWSQDRVLENAILRQEENRSTAEVASERRLTDLPLPEFLSRLAGAQPAPGGGSAAALAGALAASLVAMVSGLTAGRKGFEEVAEPIARIGDGSRALAAVLTRAIDEDARAYEAVMDAYRLPKADASLASERAAAIQAAMQRAAAMQLVVAKACLDAAELALRVVRIANPNAMSDAAVGALLALAGLEGALLNVATNLDAIEDTSYVAANRDEITRMSDAGSVLRAELAAVTHGRIRRLSL